MAALPWIALAIQAVGQIRQSEAEAASKKYNAQVAETNAQVTQAQMVTASEAQQRESARRIGAMVAAYGAAGVEGSIGSPMDVLADNVRAATLDNLNLRYNYKLKATGFMDQASLERSNAKFSKEGGYLSAAGMLAGGAAKSYYNSSGSSIPSYGSSAVE